MHIQITLRKQKHVFIKISKETTAKELEKKLGYSAGSINKICDKFYLNCGTPLVNGTDLSDQKTRFDPKNVGKKIWRCEIVSGRYAGEYFYLTANTKITFGNATSANICAQKAQLHPEHAQFVVSKCGNKIFVHPLNENAPTFVNGKLVTKPHPILPQDFTQIGVLLLRFNKNFSIPQTKPKSFVFNRPPNIPNITVTQTINLPPAAPKKPANKTLPWFTYLVPLLLAVTLATLTGRFVMLLLALTAPILAVGNFYLNTKQNTKKHLKATQEWQKIVKQTKQALFTYKKLVLKQLWENHPDPLTMLERTQNICPKLWKHRQNSTQALQIRVGVGQTQQNITTNPINDSQQFGVQHQKILVTETPITLDLKLGMFGCAGNPTNLYKLVCWVIAQLAVNSSPQELKIVLICPTENQKFWDWIRWLPHIQNTTENNSTQTPIAIGNTLETQHKRIIELTNLIKQRKQQPKKIFKDILIIFDCAIILRKIPGTTYVMQQGPKVGIYAIASAKNHTQLPQECVSTLSLSATNPNFATLTTENEHHQNILVDQVSNKFLEKLARNLAPITHFGEENLENKLPTKLKFSEIVSTEAKQFYTKIVPPKLHILFGKTRQGKYELDLLKAGPHMLIGGTTGSGKSEFLQSFLLNLAIQNRCDTLNFMFIDYKGGATFNDFQQLPHTVGMVTNLDSHETKRALAALEAEVLRREKILLQLEVKDINTAWKQVPNKAAELGLSYLLLVVDEFAELKTALPQFLESLVKIGRVGRSLGLHLVLATQKPNGNITAQIQANVTLRIALRTADKADSYDIVGSPVAAHISKDVPGRGFVGGVGQGGVVEFQSPEVGCVYKPVLADMQAQIFVVAWEQLGLCWQSLGKNLAEAGEGDTELVCVIKSIVSLCDNLQIPVSKAVWLPSLPKKIGLNELGVLPKNGGKTINIALVDVPSEQSYVPLVWNIGTSLLVVGCSGAGRTSFLRTVISGITKNYDSSEVNLHLVDYGLSEVALLKQVPHFGNVIQGDDFEYVWRVLQYLGAQILLRQKLLVDCGTEDFSQVQQLCNDETNLSNIVVFVDNFEEIFLEQSFEVVAKVRQQIVKIVKEGSKVGVALVLAANHSVLGEQKILSVLVNKIVLRLNDMQDYRMLGVDVGQICFPPPPGRGYYFSPGSVGHKNEVQLALPQMLGGELVFDTKTQNETIKSLCKFGVAKFVPFEIVVLPKSLGVADLDGYVQQEIVIPKVTNCDQFLGVNFCVGVGGDRLVRLQIFLPPGGGFGVFSQFPGRGKTETLVFVLCQLVCQKLPVVVVSCRESNLTCVAESLQVPVFWGRQRLGEEKFLAWVGGLGQVVLLVDDLHLLVDTRMGEVVEQFLRQENNFSICVFSSAMFRVGFGVRNIFSVVKDFRQGLVLCPAGNNVGDFFGVEVVLQGLDVAVCGRAVLVTERLFVDFGVGFLLVQVPKV